MRKATLVLATSVAFLLSVVPNSYAGIKKKVQLPASQSVANGSGFPVKSGNSLSIPGQLQQEYIPADNFSRSTPVKVLPTIDFSIPRTINQAKGLLRANAGSIVVGGVIAGMIAGLDWVMSPDNTQIQKKVSEGETVPSSQFGWVASPGGWCGGQRFSTHAAAQTCIVAAAKASFPATWTVSNGPIVANGPSSYIVNINVLGPTGSPISGQNASITSAGSCVLPSRRVGDLCVNGSPTYAPVAESDFDMLDAYANAQSSEWLKGLLRESCEGSLAPQRCYEDLRDNVSLSGPSTVSGPSTFATTTGPNGTTTKETKTNFQITYGSDYFIYAPTTTTTTVNPDGTTEVETEEETTEEEPQDEEIDSTIGDPYAPVVTKYNDIAGGLGDLEGNMSFINYGPWYSFGGACSPVTLNLPVMGVYTINHCPYVIDWIRPTLGFLFAVWTWLHCFALWRETLQNARPI